MRFGGGTGDPRGFLNEFFKGKKKTMEERVLMVEASDKNGRQMLQRVAGII